MTVSITTTGNGKFTTGQQGNVISSYSIAESATATSVTNLAGEIPTLSVAGKRNSVETQGATHPSSLLLLDNQITIEDSQRGTFTGRIVDVNVNLDSVSISAQSAFEPLNATYSADSYDGTVGGALEYYFSLAGITSVDIDASLYAINVVYPGWSGDLWTNLKMLCVSVSAEMYVIDGVIFVAPRGQKTFNMNNTSSYSLDIIMPKEVKKSIFTLYDTSWVTNGIAKMYGANDNAESIDFNEKKEIAIETPIALNSVNTPEYLGFPPITYIDYTQEDAVGTTPADYPNGFYALRDKNGRILPASVVSLAGVSIVPSVSEDNPFEIILTVNGPNIQYNTPWTFEFSDKYPALMLTGTGAYAKSRQVPFGTGLGTGDAETTYDSNPFLAGKKALYNTAYYANQLLGGPKLSISLATDIIREAEGQEFGFLPGAIFEWEGSKYRVENVSYNYASISLTASQYVTFDDFNTLWAGRTITEFNDLMFDPIANPNEYMKYSDLAIIPLMEPV